MTGKRKFETNRNGVAAVFGVAPDTVSAWVRKGCPTVEKRGRELIFFLPDVVAWRYERLNNDGLDLQREQARLAREQADKLEMENVERRQNLVAAETIVPLWDNLVNAIRSTFLSVPTRAAPLVIECQTLPEAKDVLEALVHDVLRELSSTAPEVIADGVIAYGTGRSPS